MIVVGPLQLVLFYSLKKILKFPMCDIPVPFEAHVMDDEFHPMHM